MLNVEKIYVVHYTRLIERRSHMDTFFRCHDIEAEYIQVYDQDELTEEIIDQYYCPSEEDYNDKILGTYGTTSNPYRLLRPAEISCTMKHYEAIRRLSTEVSDYGLIFEDDIMFNPNFVSSFNSYLKKTPKDWDAIFFGGCCGMDVSRDANLEKVAYRKDHPATKCADGYLLRKDLAAKIEKTMKPFVTISDWELSHQLHMHDATVYWWSPPLIAQGSEHGLFNTTLR
jgi:glycosyl transferase, family 25